MKVYGIFDCYEKARSNFIIFDIKNLYFILFFA